MLTDIRFMIMILSKYIQNYNDFPEMNFYIIGNALHGLFTEFLLILFSAPPTLNVQQKSIIKNIKYY